jgi:hypothetical protein
VWIPICGREKTGDILKEWQSKRFELWSLGALRSRAARFYPVPELFRENRQPTEAGPIALDDMTPLEQACQN